jgi:hypothetical protein
VSVNFRGGFNGACRDQMSPALQARIAAADAEDQAWAMVDQRHREPVAQALEQARMTASVTAAQARGEAVSLLEAARNGGVGRTRAEAVAYYSALGDVQEQREAALQRKAQQRILQELDEGAQLPGDRTPEQVEQERIALSVQLAQARGEAVDIGAAFAAGGVGRTPREAIMAMSAAADLQDARDAVAARTRLQRAGELLAQQQADEQEQSVAARVEAFKARRRQREDDDRVRALASSVVRVSQPLTDRELEQAETYRARS